MKTLSETELMVERESGGERRARRNREKIKIFTREIPYLGKDSSEFSFLNAPGFNPAK